MTYEYSAKDINGNMLLQAKTNIDGKTWWFELIIPNEYWDDLFQSNTLNDVGEVYAQSNDFWNSLVRERADELRLTITDTQVGQRHLRAEGFTFEEVQRKYNSFQQAT